MSAELRNLFRTFRVATWLGWQIESNWASPWIYIVHSILRPLSTALILLLMYSVIAGTKRDPFFDYLYINNALYIIVMGSIGYMAGNVIEDREHYRMLKYIYTSPVNFFTYLLGRGAASALIGMATSIFLLVTGSLFLGLHLNLASVQWGWLVLYFITGLPLLLSLGMIVGGCALVLPRNVGEFMGLGIAGMLLLVCSVYFPPDILPPLFRHISLAMPVTYWLEGMRRALVGYSLMTTSIGGVSAPISPLLARFSNGELGMILACSSAIGAVAAYYCFRWIERQAKSRGMIDRITGF